MTASRVAFPGASHCIRRITPKFACEVPQSVCVAFVTSHNGGAGGGGGVAGCRRRLAASVAGWRRQRQQQQ